jgi:hypothetical protein
VCVWVCVYMYQHAMTPNSPKERHLGMGVDPRVILAIVGGWHRTEGPGRHTLREVRQALPKARTLVSALWGSSPYIPVGIMC